MIDRWTQNVDNVKLKLITNTITILSKEVFVSGIQKMQCAMCVIFQFIYYCYKISNPFYSEYKYKKITHRMLSVCLFQYGINVKDRIYKIFGSLYYVKNS